MFYILYILAGIITGLLSGFFGIGGGIIIVPTLIVIFKNLNLFPANLIMPIATATSLAAVIFTSASSAFAYNKRKLIVWAMFGRFMPGIIIGIIMGKILTQFLSSETLINGFAVFLILVAAYMYFKNDKNMQPTEHHLTFLKKILYLLISICIGILTIFFGIGGGIILVPTFISLGLNIRNAAGTSAMCGVFIASTATIICIIANLGHNYSNPGLIGYVYWPGALIITTMSVFFAPIGVKIAGNFPQNILRKIFAIILTCIAAYLMKT